MFFLLLPPLEPLGFSETFGGGRSLATSASHILIESFFGKPFVNGPEAVPAFGDTALRASVYENFAAKPAFEGAWEIGAARETELAESEGKTLWFAALLRAFHAGCRVAGPGEVGEIRGVAGIEGFLFLALELTLAGGAARLRLRLVLVVRDFATLASSS